MINNIELFKMKKKQKITNYAFFSYVSQITNKNILNIFLSDQRFIDTVIDPEKVQTVRLKLKYKRNKAFKKKPSCIISGRHRAKIAFFGYISRFRLKEMVRESEFLFNITRSS